MERESRFAAWEFEARIVRAFHDQPKAQQLVERDGLIEIAGRGGDLVETHEREANTDAAL